MRLIFGVMSLLIVMVVIGILAKKQLRIQAAVPVATQNPALAGQGISPVTSPGQPLHILSQQIQQQIKQSVEAAMQQAHPAPDIEK
ncbi:MAG: hypothetical protein JWR68_135 [Polaromonas sp.]|nr:hypothetical protein [Polaromonas sp.]